MKIVCISDTHFCHWQMDSVPDGDLLIHAGDITRQGLLEDVRSFNEWLATLPHRHKICICGNHDFCFERQPDEARSLITAAHYLQDEAMVIDGLKVYGSPWQPWFFDWAFNLQRGAEIREKWDLIPEDTDVLVTHGPAYGILDRVKTGELVGCEELLSRIQSLKQLKLHVAGHIHEAYGEAEFGGVKFVNASICKLTYEPSNLPIVVEL